MYGTSKGVFNQQSSYCEKAGPSSGDAASENAEVSVVEEAVGGETTCGGAGYASGYDQCVCDSTVEDC